jgi:hypothetical protein
MPFLLLSPITFLLGLGRGGKYHLSVLGTRCAAGVTSFDAIISISFHARQPEASDAMGPQSSSIFESMLTLREVVGESHNSSLA